MKKLWMIIMTVMLQQWVVSAQDLIVTTDGEEINCKITQIRGDYVHFTYYNQNQLYNTLINKRDVDFYQYDYFRDSDLQSYQSGRYIPSYPRWWIAFNCGVGVRTDPLYSEFNDSEKQFYNNLKNGLNMGLSTSYFFNKLIGAGLKCDLFNSSNSISNYKEHHLIGFVGPSYTMRMFDHSKTHCFFGSYSIGFTGYYVKVTSFGQSGRVTGGTLGQAWELGYDVAFSKKWSTGIQLSYFSGVLTKVKFSSNGTSEQKKLDKDQYEGLNRLNISLAVRCNL